VLHFILTGCCADFEEVLLPQAMLYVTLAQLVFSKPCDAFLEKFA